MYDRATRTLWHQFTGKPIIGELVGSDIDLRYFPTARTKWGDWRSEHPDTTVLTREGATYPAWSYTREDDERSIYFDYRANPDTMFPVPYRDDDLRPKAEVVGVTVNGIHKAYHIKILQQRRIVHDKIDDENVLIVASATSSDAHIYENPNGLRFRLTDNAPTAGFPSKLIDNNGDEWLVNRDQLVNADDPSITLPAIPSNVSFWFGWYAFHRDTEVW